MRPCSHAADTCRALMDVRDRKESTLCANEREFRKNSFIHVEKAGLVASTTKRNPTNIRKTKAKCKTTNL